MRLRSIVSALLLLVLVLVVAEMYTVHSVKPVYAELSDLRESSEGLTLTARIYIPNRSPLPVRMHELTVSLNCGGRFFGRAVVYNVTVQPENTTIVAFTVTTPPYRAEECTLDYSWSPEILALIPLDVLLLNFSGSMPLQGSPSKPFIWAGWAATEIKNGTCTSFRVVTRPPSSFEVSVMADYRLPQQVPVFTGSGEGEGTFSFCPPNPSSFRLKGYYIVVQSQGRVWVQSESYPPRLTVSP